MAAFVGGFTGTPVRSGAERSLLVQRQPVQRRVALTPRAVIALPKVQEGRWKKVEEPLYPLMNEKELEAVINSSFVEEFVVVAVLSPGDATSDVVEKLLKNYAQEFANLPFYSITASQAGPRFDGMRVPRVVVYSNGEAVEDRHCRITNARSIRDVLKNFADKR
eukprot:CAMPEP_0198736376 /NCGR_PEP_ID=MMETSP1475-20131203/65390_1 /TAXON_ID= ORGANISM="Unidentified sp., Strain CCMP1999" /NCGR_SAMPLE_ID=MMETSP1475 /ASSEMBLY_ACC=CAM_ASM_001111 /LENGTH=163 /DNA_ID=CAMNT_0044500179 /DNA_START=49 /DNA_END=540 /DNA_ORIENTATION=+